MDFSIKASTPHQSLGAQLSKKHLALALQCMALQKAIGLSALARSHVRWHLWIGAAESLPIVGEVIACCDLYWNSKKIEVINCELPGNTITFISSYRLAARHLALVAMHLHIKKVDHSSLLSPAEVRIHLKQAALNLIPFYGRIQTKKEIDAQKKR